MTPMSKPDMEALADLRRQMFNELGGDCNHERLRETWNEIEKALDALRTAAPASVAVPVAWRDAVELAYGVLWMLGSDRSRRTGQAKYVARGALLSLLDRAGQGRGIDAARKALKWNGEIGTLNGMVQADDCCWPSCGCTEHDGPCRWKRPSLSPKKTEGGVLQDDLRELLDVLGMPSGAQPRSPHDVFHSALVELKRQLSVQESFERSISALGYDGSCANSLTVGEIRRAL